MKAMFVHENAEAKIVLDPAVFDQSPLQGSDTSTIKPWWAKQPTPKWGKTVHFKPMRSGPEVIDGKTYRGHVFIEDPDLYARLRLHPRYGLKFIALDMESGVEMLPEDAFFVSLHDGSFKCVACEGKKLENSQGVAGHRKSKSHSDNVNQYLNRLRDVLSGY